MLGWRAPRIHGGGGRPREGREAREARETRGAAVAQRSEQTGPRRVLLRVRWLSGPGSGPGVGRTCGVVVRRRAVEAPPRLAAGQVCEQHALVLSQRARMPP